MIGGGGRLDGRSTYVLRVDYLHPYVGKRRERAWIMGGVRADVRMYKCVCACGYSACMLGI